jgi:primosomal protein N' (replication factor Y) (superfamily II helicase)
MTSANYWGVAVPCPLRQLFTYSSVVGQPVGPGDWVDISFGRRRLTGLVMEQVDKPEGIETKPVLAVADPRLRLPPGTLELIRWVIRYYHAAPGDAVASLVPSRISAGRAPAGETCWTAQPDQLRAIPQRAKRQAELYQWLSGRANATTTEAEKAGFARRLLTALHSAGLVTRREDSLEPPLSPAATRALHLPNQAQTHAIETISNGQKEVFLLEGVTGSGKSLVYQYLAQRALNSGRQVLVLVPEIGLVPSMIEHMQASGFAVAGYHSGMTDIERAAVWLGCAAGKVRLVVGTRSAILLPMPELAIIMVDEEQDSSYKQQEGIRYNARDLAVYRAGQQAIPVVLGSATPSLETLRNVETGRYRHCLLPERIGGSPMPDWRFIDVRGAADELAVPALEEAMHRHLSQGRQVLVFLNRRGFAPLLTCLDCGWQACCDRCDVRYTYHRAANRLRCHQCDAQMVPPVRCPQCRSPRLDYRGRGTERLEQRLSAQFAGVPVIRIDRDVTRGKLEMERRLAVLKGGGAAILVGTQMLAKGHHLPNLTLAVIFDFDHALLSPDFRAREQAVQLAFQVAGRAGREARNAEIMLLTEFPGQPLLQYMADNDYPAYARFELDRRREHSLPPLAHMALLRVEGNPPDLALRALQTCLSRAGLEQVQILGPHPCLTERRQGRYRYQLQLGADSRSLLHSALERLLENIPASTPGARLKWILDVDPGGIDG